MSSTAANLWRICRINVSHNLRIRCPLLKSACYVIPMQPADFVQRDILPVLFPSGEAPSCRLM